MIRSVDLEHPARLSMVELKRNEIIAKLHAETVLIAHAQIVAGDRCLRLGAQDGPVVELPKLVAVGLVYVIAEVGEQVQAILDQIGLNLAGRSAGPPMPFARQTITRGLAATGGVQRSEAAARQASNGGDRQLVAGGPMGVVGLQGQAATVRRIARRILQDPVGAPIVGRCPERAVVVQVFAGVQQMAGTERRRSGDE